MQTTVIQAFRNRENSVEILAVKRFRQLGFNPLIALNTLTFRTVSIPATVVRNPDFSAFIAPVNVTAKRSCTAIFKRIQYPFVIIQNTVLLIETALVSPNYIRDFKLRFHPKNGKVYPMDFSPISVIPELCEDR